MLLATNVAGQSLTMEQCVEKALESNLQVKTSENGRLQAEQQISEVRSGLFPTISAGGSYQYYFNVPVQIIPAELFGGTEGQYIAGALQVPQTLSGNIQATQTIFNSSVLIGLKAAKVGRQAAQLQVRQTKEEVVYNVSATYYNILTIYKQQSLLQSNLESVEKLIGTTRILYENDVAQKTDVNRLETNRKSLLTQLENTRVTENQLLNTLKIFTGTPIADSIAVDTSVQAQNSYPLPYQGDSTSYRNRSDYQLLDVQRTAQLLERENIRAAAIPTLSATGSLAYYGYNNEFAPFKQINDKFYPASYIGLNLNIPIFEGGKRTAQAKYKTLELRNTELQLQLQRENISAEIDNAIKKFSSNVSQIRTQEENLALAGQSYRDVQLQYQEGIAGISDVLSANDELQRVQNEYLSALVNIRIAALELEKAYGVLLN